jgi:hypothetical protein
VTLPAAAKGNNEPIRYEFSTSIEMLEASSAQQENSHDFVPQQQHRHLLLSGYQHIYGSSGQNVSFQLVSNSNKCKLLFPFSIMSHSVK